MAVGQCEIAMPTLLALGQQPTVFELGEMRARGLKRHARRPGKFRRRQCLAADPLGKANYEFAKNARFILEEDRLFLKNVSSPASSKVQP